MYTDPPLARWRAEQHGRLEKHQVGLKHVLDLDDRMSEKSSGKSISKQTPISKAKPLSGLMLGRAIKSDERM